MITTDMAEQKLFGMMEANFLEERRQQRDLVTLAYPLRNCRSLLEINSVSNVLNCCVYHCAYDVFCVFDSVKHSF